MSAEGDHEDSAWVFIRKLPNCKVMPVGDHLSAFCAEFGAVLKVVMMHGRRQALVEMTTAAEARFPESSPPAILNMAHTARR
jgi:hypothetical protein